MSDLMDTLAPATDSKSPPPPKPPRAKVAAGAPAWRPMESAPKDGSWVYLQGDPSLLEWSWYQTRQFRKGSWQPIAWWRSRLGTESPPKFSPAGWRRISEGLPE